MIKVEKRKCNEIGGIPYLISSYLILLKKTLIQSQPVYQHHFCRAQYTKLKDIFLKKITSTVKFAKQVY